MGFLDRVKGAMSQMTGGAGNMQLQIEGFSFQRGQTLNFSAVLNATGPLKGKSVTVEITGEEQVKYEERVQNNTSSGSTDTRYEQRTKTNQTYHYAQPVDPNAAQMNE